MATINQIPMTIMGNIVKDLDPKRTAGGKTVITFRSRRPAAPRGTANGRTARPRSSAASHTAHWRIT